MLARHSKYFDFETPLAEAKQVIFGAPFDGTTSNRPGTRFAPALMRLDAINLESYSPYQDRDLAELKVADIGDLDLPFGNPKRVLDLVEKQSLDLLELGKIPVMIGGEHLLSLGAVRAARTVYPKLELIHLDAHTDLRTEYLGESLSHATVIRHCYDLLGPGRIHSYGVRSGLQEEFQFAKTHLDFHPFDLSAMAELKGKLAETPVYVTIDLDVLDPAFFPGTGTPEPGGVTFQELLTGLAQLKGLNIVAFDLVELSPPYDSSGISSQAACKVLREMLFISD